MTTHAQPSAKRPSAAEVPDLREHGGPKDGQPQTLDRRLFFSLQAFGGCRDPRALIALLDKHGVPGVLYAELGDPYGVGLLTFSEDESFFVSSLRCLAAAEAFAPLSRKPEFALFGRTYSLGYEPDLEDWLLGRPRARALDPELPWAVWYPLRRKGEFSRLPAEEQKGILREHGAIGLAYGQAGLAQDIRLACHGLDKDDNDFVIGLLGKRLHPLSALVERMRRTVQTSLYIQAMGPFFIGKALWKAKI